ncbi:MAG: sigma 54-interacting transcriptional regulator [Anaerolineae bacterium]|jgi:transcriptional activator for dhaKLM operon
MLPSSYPYDRAQLKAAWTSFVQTGQFSSTPLDPAVKRSWRACLDANLDASSRPRLTYCEAQDFEQRQQASFDLIAVARPFMEDIYQFSGERDMALYLTDQTLCAVDWLGDSVLFGVLEEKGLRPGVNLRESQVGTNAAALALSEGIPVQVAGPEHFYHAFHFITGTAAPIHTTTGQMLGVIGLVTLEENSHPHTLGIVMAAAKAIENQLQADQILAEAHHHLGELNASLQAISKGMVLIDSEGTVSHINASAGKILGISHRTAMGRSFSSLVQIPPELETVIAQQDTVAKKEVVFRVDGEPQSCLVSVDLLEQGSRFLGFVLTLEHTAEAKRLVHQMVGARAHFTFDDILGHSVKMRRVLYYARTIAKCSSPVLLLGESGTGKEFFAQAIHNASEYADGPFIAFDCAAVPRELMAGELFGYEQVRNATDEEGGRLGKLELAEGGTIFFDHVDSMPPNIQASLLRVIDKKEINRLGGNRVIPIDVRIVAASNNLDLAGEVKEGRFRADFFYRLRAMTLTVPPLRERGDDLLMMIAHLTDELAQRQETAVRISPRAMAVLRSYQWPGNVRELENVLEWAMHMASGSEITIEHLPQELRRATLSGEEDEQVLTLQEAERQAIIQAGQALEGHVTKMADALGIGRTTLWRKMKAYDLSTETFKRDDGAALTGRE